MTFEVEASTPSAGEKISAFENRFRQVRDRSVALSQSLSPEDCSAQSMPDASPVKWHLAHTTWFWEVFLLTDHASGYRPFHPDYRYLFNSYYEGVGPRWQRSQRGLLTRPSFAEVLDYRCVVDREVMNWFAGAAAEEFAKLSPVLEIGLQHEQQHQELLLTDVKHLFSCNPLEPVFRGRVRRENGHVEKPNWLEFDGGVHRIGRSGADFAFDNETPNHRVFLEPFRLADRPTTNGEFVDFIEADGYARPEYWLSEGWAFVQNEGLSAPLYWSKNDGRWSTFTLAGRLPLIEAEPVCHVSYFEADAYARYAQARLPTEAEWEVAAGGDPVAGEWLESERFHPLPLGATSQASSQRWFGDVWEWTSSAYAAYPGYRPAEGAIGEYNGKFMCNQMVLRGGSCVTPSGHVRASYRNFFPASARWQFSGFRLASEGGV